MYNSIQQRDTFSSGSGGEQGVPLSLLVLGLWSASVPPSGSVPVCYQGHFLYHLCSSPTAHELWEEDQSCYGRFQCILNLAWRWL